VQQNLNTVVHAPNVNFSKEVDRMAVVQRKELAPEHGSEEMKNNDAVVMSAVQQNGVASEHASEKMNNDATIVMAAVRASTEVRFWGAGEQPVHR
jgi:hypothetical protein